MNNINSLLANNILFQDPETGEELRPLSAPDTDENGDLILLVENKDGSRNWKHTIRTEEV